MPWIWEPVCRLMWFGMNIQMHVAPLSGKAASELVLRNRPASSRSTRTRCSCREKIPTWYLDKNTLSQSFIQEEHGWAVNARNHQGTSTSQLISAENIKPQLVHEMGWAGWGLLWSLAFTSLLSQLGNSTTLSAKSGAGHVIGWVWGMAWRAVVPALRAPTWTHAD